MHRHDPASEVLTQAIVRYAVDRVRLDPPPLDHPRTVAELRAMAGRTITPRGLGGLEALRVFADVLAPACLSVDHPSYLSFVPAAPTEASILFDLVVGASSIYAGTWLEASGAVYAENEALRWIADVAGLPAGAGGVFVSGGTAGNLERAAGGAVEVAGRRRGRPRPHPRAARGVGRRPFVGGPGGAGDGCRRGARAGRRARQAHRTGARGDRWSRSPPPTGSGCSPWSPPPAPPTPVSSTTCAPPPRPPTPPAPGCTSTPPTAAPG